jgi:signal transduction histidine kinase/chemotaxis methyl-accepting protein methylase/ActR/RegA family two-component response regulator
MVGVKVALSANCAEILPNARQSTFFQKIAAQKIDSSELSINVAFRFCEFILRERILLRPGAVMRREAKSRTHKSNNGKVRTPQPRSAPNTREQWDNLQLKVNAALSALPVVPGEDVRIWVPGCGSGETVYAIAICLEGTEPTQKRSVRIFGTDDDEGDIGIARAGRYGPELRRIFPPEIVNSYFSSDDQGYRIRRGLREACIFATHNIFKNAPFSKLDLIYCENPELLQSASLRRLAPIFHFALKESGCLIINNGHEIFQELQELYQNNPASPFVFSRRPGSGSLFSAVEMTVQRPSKALPATAERRKKKENDTRRQLEAAREELRSVNQDLSNFFEELEDRNRELSRLNDDLSNLFSSIRLPLIMVDSNLRIRRFNTAAQESFKLIPQDSGRSISEVQCNLRINDLSELVSKVIESGTPHEQEVQDRAGHWYMLRIRPYISSQNMPSGAVIGLVDINAIKQSRDEEQKARAEAEAANRMKDDFLATLSHELRTPMTPMLGWVKLLRSEKLDEGQKLKGLEIIERSVKAQRQLIEDLLDISRIVTGKFELKSQAVDLLKVLESAIETVSPMAKGKSIEIETDLTPVENTTGDADRLRQAFWNVLVNAVKFTPDGGRITVRMRNIDRTVEVKITDTGEGISPTLLPHLFERFRQGDSSTTRKYGGLGIGLSIVRTVVELHGGRVAAESEGLGKGASFTVTLPIRKPEANAQPEPAQDAATSQQLLATSKLQGLKALVIDDHAETRDFLSISLEAAGALVRSCSSAREGLSAYEEFAPDVLISDIGMPSEDGLWLIEKIREVERKQGMRAVPAIALTALAMASDRKHCLEAGFARHISKPVSISELIETVGELAGAHMYN